MTLQIYLFFIVGVLFLLAALVCLLDRRPVLAAFMAFPALAVIFSVATMVM